VDQVVVMPAEQDQVLQAGRSAVGPVLDVMQCRSVKSGGALLQEISGRQLVVHVGPAFASGAPLT
jgi:hypothetical protein